MSAITDILGQLPIEQLAGELGVSQEEAKKASTQVITSLLGGMTANSQDSAGEELLAGALMKHRGKGETYASGGVKLSGIDTKDGSKIVKHTMGASTAKTAAALSAKTGTDKTLIQKLLPILAPIVIAYIANKVFSNQGSTASADPMGSIVGGLLGGGNQSSSDVVGSLVGGLLGGGQSQGSGNLGSVLGNILGGALGNDQASKAQSSSGGVLGGLLDALF